VLSSKGKKLIKKLEIELDPLIDKLTSNLTPQEVKKLNLLLDKMRG
jgi:DNA-binding MarR family transcriptional regulator